MNARIVVGQFQPGKIDEGVRHFRETVVTRAKKYPGFKGALMLTDPNTRKLVAITLWETEAALKATETGFQESAAQLAQTLAGPPTEECYEVSVQVQSLNGISS